MPCVSSCVFMHIVNSLCSGIPPLPPPLPLFFFSFPTDIVCPWRGDPWLGCRVVPATGALFNLGAGRQKWNPLDIPGTQPPLSKKVVINGSENSSKGEVQAATVALSNNLKNMFNQKFPFIRSHIYFVQLSNKHNQMLKAI